VATTAAVLFVFDPGLSSFYPGCFFYRSTGLLCPGCGSLRALHQLLHGNFATALRFNPLLFVTLFLVGLIIAARLLRRKKVPPIAAASTPAFLPLHPIWIWAYLGLALAFWVLRNLPGPVFALLRP
jgi:hypothetical protein